MRMRVSTKSRFKGPMTAGELMRELESDPEWVAQEEARERWREKQAEKFAREEAPILREIAENGLIIDSIADLVNTREPYPEAIPVLLRHLKKGDYSPDIRDTLARSLTVRGYPEILPAMIEAFRRDPDPRLNGPKWAMGNAIRILFDDKYVEEIAALARDQAHGEARSELAFALGKSKTKLAEETLQELRSDPQITVYVQEALKRRDSRRRKRKSDSS